MKKISLLLFAMSLSLMASAQNKSLPISVKAGVTFPKITTNSDGIAHNNGSINESSVNPSFYFGASVDLHLTKMTFFQTGFTIIGKGTKASYDNYLPGSKTSGKINLLYFEIPANVVTYIPVGKNKIFVGLGPYVGFALSGKAKYTFISSDDIGPGKENIRFGSDKDFKRLDFGGNFLTGYQLRNGLNIHGGISASALNISNSKDSYLKAKNLVYSVGLGFSL